MGYDKSAPRNNVILGVGILASVTLLALVPVFHSYFHYMMGREYAEKVEQVPTTELGHYRDEQQGRLGSARVSVEQAMAQLAQNGRTGAEAIAPHLNQDSADVDAVEGWGQLKNERGAAQARSAFERAKAAREARAAAVDGGVAPDDTAPATAEDTVNP